MRRLFYLTLLRQFVFEVEFEVILKVQPAPAASRRREAHTARAPRHSERLLMTFIKPQHSEGLPPPRLECLGIPLAMCVLPSGVSYLLTYSLGYL